MNITQQTNNTSLFEGRDSEKLDLTTLGTDTKELNSLNDDKIKEINEDLTVNSFEEFLEKFAPSVYSFFKADSEIIMYAANKSESLPNELVNFNCNR